MTYSFVIPVVNPPFSPFPDTSHLWIYFSWRQAPRKNANNAHSKYRGHMGSCSQAANVYVMLNIVELVLYVLWKGQNLCNLLAHTVVPPMETACANLAFSQKPGPKGWIAMLLLQDTPSIVKSTLVAKNIHQRGDACCLTSMYADPALVPPSPIVFPGLMGGCTCQDRPVNKNNQNGSEWNDMLLG